MKWYNDLKKAMILMVWAAMALHSCSKDIDEAVQLTDIEGNVYETVTIGEQLWMAENLRTRKYNNGDPILTTTGALSSQDAENRFQWVYDNDKNNGSSYGRLYTWYTITDSRGICPDGWHIPTHEEIDALVESLGGLEIVGGKLKAAGYTDWRFPNTDATNESGFTMLPAGGRYMGGYFGGVCQLGGFWASTEYNTGNAWGLWLSYGSGRATGYIAGKLNGFPVRCIKDN